MPYGAPQRTICSKTPELTDISLAAQFSLRSRILQYGCAVKRLIPAPQSFLQSIFFNFSVYELKEYRRSNGLLYSCVANTLYCTIS